MEKDNITIELTRAQAQAISNLVGGCDGYLALHILAQNHKGEMAFNPRKCPEELLEQEWQDALHGWRRIYRALEAE